MITIAERRERYTNRHDNSDTVYRFYADDPLPYEAVATSLGNITQAKTETEVQDWFHRDTQNGERVQM